MIYSVDRDGWGRAFESLKEAEGYLEWLDVKEDEYAVLDRDAHQYRGIPDETGYYEYRFQRTESRNENLLQECLDALAQSSSDFEFRIPSRRIR